MERVMTGESIYLALYQFSQSLPKGFNGICLYGLTFTLYQQIRVTKTHPTYNTTIITYLLYNFINYLNKS